MLIKQDFYLSRNDKCQDSTPSGDHLPYMEEVILLCHTQKRGKQHQIFLFMHLDKILNLFDNRCMHQEKVQIPADRSPNAPPPPQDLLMACSPSDTQLSLPQNVRQFIFAQCFKRVNRKLGTCNLFEFLGVENKESGKNIGPILQFFPQA